MSDEYVHGTSGPKDNNLSWVSGPWSQWLLSHAAKFFLCATSERIVLTAGMLNGQIFFDSFRNATQT
jgi:hypothetical protein